MADFVRAPRRGWWRDVNPDVVITRAHQRRAGCLDGGCDGRAVAFDPRALARQPAAHFHPHGPSARSRGGTKRSEEHTSELQSLMRISYAVFCLKKKKQNN